MKIEKLILFSSNLKGQLHFYEHVLGFECLQKSATEVEFRIGNSILAFHYKEKSDLYHFAFNIPAFSVEAAHRWLTGKVDFLTWEGEDILLFNDWKAQAIYFKDADGNIVEFIARDAVGFQNENTFSTKSVLNISEIGIGSSNIPEIVNALNAIKPITLFDGNIERFCALGDEEGLFIVANSNLKTWMPTGDTIMTADFEIYGTYNFSFNNGKINVIL